MNQPPPPSSASREQLIGVVLADRYEVLEPIGEGGMGSVYVGRHVTLGKHVALKVLKAELAHDKTTVQRFLREAKSTSRIEHDNVVDILDFGETPAGSAFFVMEFLRGKELTDVMLEGRMDWYRVKPILLQLCYGLGAAHDNGIVHRDMKPGNVILLNRSGRTDFVKILDFGIAKVEDAAALTQAGMVFGTAAYMAPEQATAMGVDGRSDMYALACMTFEMLTGRLPFDAKHPIKMLNCHIREPAPSMRSLVPAAKVPEAVDNIILRALSKRPEERFADMYAFARALEAIPRGEPSAPDPGGVEHTVNLTAAQARAHAQAHADAQAQTRASGGSASPRTQPQVQAPSVQSGAIGAARPSQSNLGQSNLGQSNLSQSNLGQPGHAQSPPAQDGQARPGASQANPNQRPPASLQRQRPPLAQGAQPGARGPQPGARGAQPGAQVPRRGPRGVIHAGEFDSGRTEPRKIVHAQRAPQGPLARSPRPPTDPRHGGPPAHNAPPRPRAHQAPSAAPAPGSAPPRPAGGSSKYPQNLPALTWLFVGLAECSEGELSKRELLEIAKRLWRWAQSLKLDELNGLVLQTLNEYRALPDVATRGARTREHNMELARRLPRPRRAEILTALYGIASDDGHLPDRQLRFIVNCTMQLGLSPDPRMLATAFLYITLCAADGQIDESELQVLREQSKKWAPKTSIAERAVVLRWAIAEFKRRPTPAEKMQCAREAADQLTASTDLETRRRIINDLWRLAGADGRISPQEQTFISEMVQRFRLS